MAPGGFCSHHFPFRNLLSLELMEDELTMDPGPIRGFYSSGTSSAPSHNLTPGPALILAPTPASALPSSNELFKQFMRAYLESNQRLS